MKKHPWLALWVAGAAACAVFSTSAEETAVVQAERVNVRGKPSLLGEVVTQLKRGETVTILEELPVKKPKTGEPAEWAKIKMPENTPLWVNAGFIDPTNKTVKVKRLNVRAGAGENYSVVGRLEHGAAVKEIRVVDDWMEIETPTNSYAYVAADLIQKQPGPPAAGEPPKIAEAPKPVAPPPAVETSKPEPPPPAPVDVPAVAKPAPNPPPAVAPAIAESAKPEPAAVAPPAPAPAPVTAPAPVEPKIEGPPPKRIVTREGVVRRTGSIQAPSPFELCSLETDHRIDYLHSYANHVVLKKFNRKHVVVTGEEMLDPRWPKTPILEIDTIEVAP